MKVMGRCKGYIFQLEIHNFKVLVVIKCNFVTSFLNNVGSLWPIMLPPCAQGLMLMVLSFKCVNIPP